MGEEPIAASGHRDRIWQALLIVGSGLCSTGSPAGAAETPVTYHCKGTGFDDWRFSGRDPKPIKWTDTLTLDQENRAYNWQETLPKPGEAGRKKIVEINGTKIVRKQERGTWRNAPYSESEIAQFSQGQKVNI